MKKHIPNSITCGNLLCGCLAVIKTMEGDLVWAACLVGIAAVLDFFDGFAARALKVTSPIGKDLDSLADMVTFGLVPALVMFKLIDVSCILDFMLDLRARQVAGSEAFSGNSYLKYAGLAIAVFSCLRLAKFNNDTRQSDSFIGVPTPANAILICSLPLIFHELGLNFWKLEEVLDKKNVFAAAGNLTGQLAMFALTTPWLLVGLSVAMSLLLVSELPLLALKFKSFGWAGNQVRYVFLALSVLLLIWLKITALPLVIVLYILISIVNNIFLNQKV